MKKVENWCFDVPNNDAGREFVKNLSRWRNKKRFGSPRKRGRNSDRQSIPIRLNYCQDVPVDYAERWKVYLDETPEIRAEMRARVNRAIRFRLDVLKNKLISAVNDVRGE